MANFLVVRLLLNYLALQDNIFPQLRFIIAVAGSELSTKINWLAWYNLIKSEFVKTKQLTITSVWVMRKIDSLYYELDYIEHYRCLLPDRNWTDKSEIYHSLNRAIYREAFYPENMIYYIKVLNESILRFILGGYVHCFLIGRDKYLNRAKILVKIATKQQKCGFTRNMLLVSGVKDCYPWPHWELNWTFSYSGLNQERIDIWNSWVKNSVNVWIS